MINKLKSNQLKYLPKNIYSSPDSLEEEKSLKLLLICLITFLKFIYPLLRTLANNNFHFS